MRTRWSLTLAALLCITAHAQRLQMAITVDDLPAHGKLPPGMTREQVTQSFLDTFRQQHLPPIYGFVNGIRMDQGPSAGPVLRMWHSASQPLGNHTWSHFDLSKITSEVFLAEVDRNEALLKQVDPTGDVKWLRYPYLHEGDTVEKRRAVRAGLFARGYRIAEVGMDFEDYLWNDPYARCSAMHDKAALQYLHDSYLQTADDYIGVFRSMSQQLYGRDIPYVLLMHIGAFDAKMLPELLDLYRRRGFSFVSMPEALADKAYADDPDIGEPTGGAQLELMMQARHLKIKAPAKPYKRLDDLCRVPLPPAAKP